MADVTTCGGDAHLVVFCDAMTNCNEYCCCFVHSLCVQYTIMGHDILEKKKEAEEGNDEDAKEKQSSYMSKAKSMMPNMPNLSMNGTAKEHQ